MKQPVDIILVKFNLPKIENECINSILQYTDIPYNLIVYDNYPEKENLGVLWNRLIKPLKSEYICLLNTDTLVEKNWLKKLLEVFEKESNVGAVGPTTNNSRNQQSQVPPKHFYSVLDFTKSFPKWCLSGFCLVISRKVYDEIGGFPEDFGFYGQEVALLDKMEAKGYRQMWRQDVFIHHYGSASVKKAEKEGIINEDYERTISNEKIRHLREQLELWK